MLGSSKKVIVHRREGEMYMFKPRSVCDSERDRRQNKDPLDEENLD